jgi:hypothetical protein
MVTAHLGGGLPWTAARDATHADRQRVARQLRNLGKASRRSTSQATDDAFPQAQPAGGARVLQHRAAASAQAAAIQIRIPSWPP